MIVHQKVEGSNHLFNISVAKSTNGLSVFMDVDDFG